MGEILTEQYSLGIALGLIIGKPLGIFAASFLAVKLGICALPSDLNWKTILGVGFLGGIGFTMSIFVTLLAFEDDTIVNNAKFIILLSSLIAGIIGYIGLKLSFKNEERNISLANNF
jgi:NhaA family Na+:H+ antiporter